MWLIAEHVAQELRALRAAHGVLHPEARTKFTASIEAAASSGSPRNMSVVDGVAEIRIAGVLTEEPDIWAWIFGIENTAYADIRKAVAMAETDPSIKRVVFGVDSPGGNVDGLFETADAMRSMKKPKSVRARLAASAAYALAASGGSIEAVSHASTFGSVGVVATYLVRDDVVSITSTEAPDKRPDPETSEGQAVIRKYLDAIHDLFAETIAAGRGVDAEKVNATYGRGAVMLASEAKKLGMVDKIAGARPGASTPRAEGDSAPALTYPAPTVAVVNETPKATEEAAKETNMDLKTLKAQHPDVFEAARAEGVDSEKRRCTAHLTLGKKCGAMDFAMKCIVDGRSVMEEDVHAEYLSAGMDRRDIQNRQEDDASASAALNGVESPKQTAEDLGDKVAAILAAERGKKLNG